MVLPVIVITCLAPIGMLLPANSGEKMGLQITLLLTLVVFIQSLQDQAKDKDSRQFFVSNLISDFERFLSLVSSILAVLSRYSKDFGIFCPCYGCHNINNHHIGLDALLSPHEQRRAT